MSDIFEKSGFDFVEEFRKLWHGTPKCGSWMRGSENCEYGDITTVSKDCYMCFNSGNCRNAYHCEDSRALKDCSDSAFCEGCELCYECIDCDTCYNCNYCQDCSNSNNLEFCFAMRRCNNCFVCSGLRDKQYCILNKQYSQTDYKRIVQETLKKGREYILAKLEEIRLKTPRMYTHEFDTTNCTGDYIYHSKNCHMCFDTRHSEDSGYIIQANLDMGTRDSYDCGPIPTGMDLCYDVAYAHYLFNCKHLYWCGNLKDSEYCCNCMESEHMFGCHYLKNKQKAFYILNEKVEEEFYWKKTAEIKAELEKRGIYTIYDLIFKDLSETFVGVTDEELKRKCTICGEGFEIVEKELEFYKKMKVRLPIYCPDCRAKQRINLRQERKMHKRICDFCKNTLISTFPADSPYKVYCMDCWQREIG